MSVFKRQISFKWINQTQNIFMLLSNFKFRNLYSANCEENCSWFITFEHNCSRFYILNIFPIIARFFNPRFSCQRRKGYSQVGTSFKSIPANLFCKWMCRIDNVGNFVLNNVITETLWTSKPPTRMGIGCGLVRLTRPAKERVALILATATSLLR